MVVLMPVVYHKVQFKAPFYFPSSYSHLAKVCERTFLIAVQMTHTYTSRVDTWWCKKPRFTEMKATICQAIKAEFSSNTLRWLRERISVLMDACSHPSFFGCTTTTIFPCCSALFSRFQPHALFQNGIQDFFWHSGGAPGAWGAYKMGQGTAYQSTMWLVLKRWRPNTDKRN